VTASRFVGRVFLVAGDSPVLAEVAGALSDSHGLVAMVSKQPGADDVAARFRADPTDPDVWQRVVPHVEQRLGPIDSVITDSAIRAIADRFVAADLTRRGHGAIVTVDNTTNAADVLRTLVDML
jgi:NAD(P)-dependent dehydrogenase (short-subunit alcohol dehydrogenase family)